MNKEIINKYREECAEELKLAQATIYSVITKLDKIKERLYVDSKWINNGQVTMTLQFSEDILNNIPVDATVNDTMINNFMEREFLSSEMEEMYNSLGNHILSLTDNSRFCEVDILTDKKIVIKNC